MSSDAASPELPLTRYAWLSLGASVLVLGLKVLAWYLTASVGLLSDALETLTNVGGALMALLMLRLAAQPPDDGHAFGHSKAEYISSGFEGMLIFAAAAAILVEALPRLLAPQAIEPSALGLGVAAVAGVVNFAVARTLSVAGRLHRSATLDADARHLMADVWTTVGVIAGVGLVAWTGWLWLDPAVALAIAVHVLWAGYRLMRESASNLMDAAWPEEERQAVERILDEFRRRGDAGEIEFHALRTRQSGVRRFVNFHVLVPGHWTVKRGHDFVEEVEVRLTAAFPNVTAFTHLEPSDDPVSYQDLGLDRPRANAKESG